MGRIDPDRRHQNIDYVMFMTLGDFKFRGGELRAVCNRCRTAQKIDLDVLIRLNGAHAILWGRKGRCRVWACEGEATFEGRAVPGQSWVPMRQKPSRGEMRDFAERWHEVVKGKDVEW